MFTKLMCLHCKRSKSVHNPVGRFCPDAPGPKMLRDPKWRETSFVLDLSSRSTRIP
jgi:hypothetical protein